MQSPDKRNLIFRSSLVLALAATAFVVALDFLFTQGVNPVKSAIVFVGLFGASYFAFRLVVNEFIYQKIKLIYKTIHNLKTPKQELKTMLKEDLNVLDTVNEDVVSWAENKQQEIQSLKDQEEYRREFLGNVSHELKTPIFNIQGYIHTLLDGGLEDEAINRKFLIRADHSVDRMISVVEDLEEISSLESGRVELKLEDINVVELAREVIEMQEMKASDRNMEIKLGATYDRPINVLADSNQIKQVYTNLLDNAIKYGNENGSIILRFYDMDQNTLCEVADNGPGIAEHHIPRLFERFYRVDKARDRHAGGTGLGLAIVKHIIEAHEQTINVRSNIGVN
ncbi:MAG: two-component system phosphate regulon sensor histidine kinase PhoR, partial [Psychroserpens sp.]